MRRGKVLIYGGALTILLLVFLGWCYGLDATGWASWVQAVGSIGAILATGWAVEKSHQVQVVQKKRETFDEYTSFLAGTFQLVGGMRQVAEKIQQMAAVGPITPDNRHSMLAELGAFARAFARFDLARLDRHAYLRAVMTADAVTNKLMMGIEFSLKPEFSNALEGNYIEQIATASLEILHEQGRVLHEGIEARGGHAVSDTLQL